MLSLDQIKQFETEGYLVVPDILPSDTLAAVQRGIYALLDGLYARLVRCWSGEHIARYAGFLGEAA